MKILAGVVVTSEGTMGKDVILSALTFAGRIWLLQDDWPEAAINSLLGDLSPRHVPKEPLVLSEERSEKSSRSHRFG